MKLLIIITLISISGYKCDGGDYVNKLEKIARKVNSLHTTWTANVHSIPRDIIQNFRYMAGTLKPEHNTRLSSHNRETGGNKSLPTKFDSRTQWPKCLTIAHIYDQGRCASCWAVSTTSAFSDRVCIASGAKQNVSRSAQQVLSCCNNCVPDSKRNGCKGGYMTEAYNYMKQTGVSTGGDHKSSEGCQPYKYPKCDHIRTHGYYPSCKKQQRWTSGKCNKRCYNNKYRTPFKKDLLKESVYSITSVQDAMRDIYNHGPITTLFEIYEDFLTYKKGVYQHMSGAFIGYHGVRIIGWGKEKQLPYWLIANSWNERWGENGTFRILRGENHLHIEEYMEAALPKL